MNEIKHHFKSSKGSVYFPFKRGEGREFHELEKITVFTNPDGGEKVDVVVAAVDPRYHEVFLRQPYQKGMGQLVEPGWYKLCTLKMLNKTSAKKPLLGIGKIINALSMKDPIYMVRDYRVTDIDLENGMIKLVPVHPTENVPEMWHSLVHDVRVFQNKSTTSGELVTTLRNEIIKDNPSQVSKGTSNNQAYSSYKAFKAPPARAQKYPDDKVNGFPVRDWFRALTFKTTPKGSEHNAYDGILRQYWRMAYCEKSYNYYRIIPIIDEDGNEVMPSTMFVAHMDTADSGSKGVTVNHVLDGDFIMTDGKSYLGGDDKAGMTVLLYLMSQNVPGFYLMVWGEERGRLGSIEFVREWKEVLPQLGLKRCIAFDRRGEDEIITKQSGTQGCSDTFVNALISGFKDGKLEFSPSTFGSYTDSYTFFDYIPECTNISAGYHNAHSSSERQNLAFLEDLCAAASQVDWESLPTVQEVNDRGKYYGSYGGSQWSNYKGGRSGYVSRPGEDNLAGREWWDMVQLRGQITDEDVATYLYLFPRESVEIIKKLLKDYCYVSENLTPRKTLDDNDPDPLGLNSLFFHN